VRSNCSLIQGLRKAGLSAPKTLPFLCQFQFSRSWSTLAGHQKPPKATAISNFGGHQPPAGCESVKNASPKIWKSFRAIRSEFARRRFGFPDMDRAESGIDSVESGHISKNISKTRFGAKADVGMIARFGPKREWKWGCNRSRKKVETTCYGRGLLREQSGDLRTRKWNISDR